MLIAKGNSVGYLEFPHGNHEPGSWKQELADGLIFLIASDTPAVLVDKGVPAAVAGAVPLLMAVPLAVLILRGQAVRGSPLLALLDHVPGLKGLSLVGVFQSSGR